MLDGVKKAVFIGAHTDDEQVCAGTLHRLVRQKTDVYMLTAAYAATYYDRKGTAPIKSAGRDGDIVEEYKKAAKLIGANVIQPLNLIPSSDFYPHRQAICQWVYDFLQGIHPELVITLSPEDENPAHKIVGEEVERVARGRVKTLLRCQYPWNFSIGRPNLYVSLTEEDLEVKRKVCQAYQSQKFRYDYESIFMNMCVVDGLSVKVKAAEKFEIVRTVI